MNIENLYKKLQNESFKELFGDTEEKISSNYRKYAIICHPDNCKHSLAQECFKLLEQRKNEGNKPPNLITINNKKTNYSFNKTDVVCGDFSNIYFNDVFDIKISKAPQFNILLKNEADSLKVITGDKHFNNYLPQIQDSFVINQSNNIALQTNIFSRINNNFWSLEQIKTKYTIDGRNAAWMLNRLFEVIGYIHTKDIVHANIIPSSFLVDIKSKPPDNCHGGILLNWENSGKTGSLAKFVNKKNIDFFPVEIPNKRSIIFETDIFMLGKIAIWLCSDFPKSIQNFFNSLVIVNPRRRPDNVIDLYGEFKDLLKRNYGKSKFVTLD